MVDDSTVKSATIVERADHGLSRRDIDPDALKVLYRLDRSRYVAYLVGGGVRDLLLGRRPKDFDVGTDATPVEIRQLFRNSRIIGRRFPLVHVYFRGGKIIDVSTFRQNAPAENGAPAGRDDNWGSPEEDAWRRDLTINGLFYDISTFSVIDYVGGLEDLDKGIIRTIGDPDERFREDPVRMIRAVRHAARIGFTIEPDTYAAIRSLADQIETCAPARVLEEFLRELRGGTARPSLDLLAETGLLEYLAPPLNRFITDGNGTPAEERELFWRSIGALDEAAQTERPPTDPVVLAIVFGAIVRRDVADAEAKHGDRAPDIGRVVRDRLIPLLQDLGVSRRNIEKCFHLILATRRLRKAADGGRLPAALMRKSYFPESWAYLTILLKSEGWSESRIAELVDDAPTRRRRPRRRRRRRRGRRGGSGSDDTAGDG